MHWSVITYKLLALDRKSCMMKRSMGNPTMSVIWCGYIILLCLGVKYCPWTGPFKVVEKLSSVVYRIPDTRGKRKRKVTHFNRLKPYLSRSTPPNDEAVVDPATTGSNQPTPNRAKPPGTTLCLVDNEADEVDLDQHQASALDSNLTPTDQKTPPIATGRRYPVRTNRRRPAQYHDGAVDEEDLIRGG